MEGLRRSEAHQYVKGNNMVINLYRDRQRIYFGAYDPKESVALVFL